MKFQKCRQQLASMADFDKAQVLKTFFKTGKGQYGEGDIFLGISVPEQRKVAKEYKDLAHSDIALLLKSETHEERLTGLLILVQQFEKGDERQKKAVYDFYLKNLAGINNWDLVDLSAPKILGAYMHDHPQEKKRLYSLVQSQNLWERRIAMLACYAFIRNRNFTDALRVAELLLNDAHDLIHKAVGWMLREIGKIDQGVEEGFLKKHYKTMPRTMLRYAIERFSEEKRRFYLGK